MRKGFKGSTGIYILLGIVILSLIGGGYFFLSANHAPQQNTLPVPSTISQQPTVANPSPTTPPTQPTGTVSYPPLYSKVQWGNPYPVKMQIGKQSSSGGLYTIYLDAYQTDSNIIPWNTQTWSQWGEGITLYYQHELSSLGWDRYDLDAASGPMGAAQEWTKNGHYFRVGYKQAFNGRPATGTLIGQQLYIIHN